jgi:flagellar hook-basal body complex protein FliE
MTLGIDKSRIDAMVAQLRLAGTRAQGLDGAVQPERPATKSGFAEALKVSLEQVNTSQQQAQQLGQDFALGDDKVHLSDVMIAMQKANITFQAAVQVRNKLVSAYHEIMNMQI